MNTVTFLLGAADPEMNAIAHALTKTGFAFGYAAIDGKRVHSGNAYKAKYVVDADGVSIPLDITNMVAVECALEGVVPAARCDHHAPGDFGYGLPPERYWEASSIGQVYNYLLASGEPEDYLNAVFGEDRFLVAASDHCPAHAFQGKCPGIDVDALFEMRAVNSAAFSKISIDEWKAKVNAAIELLKALPSGTINGVSYAIAEQPIELLNHAQLVAGIPVQYTAPGWERDPRIKVGLLGGTDPQLVSGWMAKMQNILTDIYGDPARGYAGGYIA